MEQYYCDCTNIIINVHEKRLINGAELVRKSDADIFFQNKLLDVVMSISGIEMAQDILSKERQYEDWRIYTCVNCNKDTHCLHSIKGTDRVLIPVNIKHGSEELSKIKASPTYSNILSFDLKEFENTMNKQPSLNSKRIAEISSKLDKTVNNALRLEEDATNERIRLFTEQQRIRFQEIKLSAKQQKEKVVSKIRRYENKESDSLFDSFNESYFGESTKAEERDLSTDLPHIPIMSSRSFAANQLSVGNSRNSIPIAQSLPTSILNKGSKPKHRGHVGFSNTARHRSFSESDDTMFDLEDFQENKNCEPFFESDEDSGDATSLESSGGYSIPSSRGLNPGDRVYATSVPVSIPLFENTKHSYDPEDEQESSPSPNHIADSIKALAIARSMQDSTGMFGELPRPRLNTFR